jgi:hypothetical protein
MERSVDVYQPSRLYSRAGWAALAGSLVCVVCGLRAPLAFIPGCLCALTGIVLFWLAARPQIHVSSGQFSIGERAIAWREIREINTTLGSPLILRLKLTNARKKALIFPGEPDRIAKLVYQLRKNSYLASFDGVAYRDFWTWSSMADGSAARPLLDHPVRMLSAEEEDEIERMFQKLKAVGRLDSRADDSRPGDS